MIPAFRRFVNDLLFNEQKARIWLRGFLLWAATVGGQVVAYPPEVVATWGVKDWALRFGIAALAGLAGLLAVGQRNPSPEAVADAVRTVEARREVGILDPPPKSMPPGNPPPASMTPGLP